MHIYKIVAYHKETRKVIKTRHYESDRTFIKWFNRHRRFYTCYNVKAYRLGGGETWIEVQQYELDLLNERYPYKKKRKG